jgi:hypothetical protein
VAKAVIEGPEVASPAIPAVPRARSVVGERVISQTLRGGALLSGALFSLSLLAELLPSSTQSSVLIAQLRRAGASMLLITPVARLAVAGATLGLRGEWRYLMYAAGVLTLLAIAVTAGFAA